MITTALEPPILGSGAFALRDTHQAPDSERKTPTSAKQRVVAILTAAGSGERLGAGQPKALVPVAGRPMFLWAVDHLLSSGVVTDLIVTCPRQQQSVIIELMAAAYPTAQNWQTVVGGATRQQSIANALRVLSDSLPSQAFTAPEIVLVHDAARPFASPGLAARVVAAVRAGLPAVIPGLPVTDTIKRVGPGIPGCSVKTADAESMASAESLPSAESRVETSMVVATVPRDDLRAIQTPQGFRRDVLERAYQAATNTVTDDAGLVEALGEKVAVIDGEQSAMKITTPIDLAYAELLAKEIQTAPAIGKTQAKLIS